MEKLFQFISFFDNYYWYFILVVIGLSMKSYQRIFFWGILGALLCMLFNSCLKAYFKIPLYPHLGPGFAFPSGHLALGTFIYAWLAKFRFFYIHRLIIFIVPAIAYATVQLHYHSYADVIAGMISGLSFFFIFYQVYQMHPSIRVRILICSWAVSILYLIHNHYVYYKTVVVILSIPILLLMLPHIAFTRQKEN